MGSEEIEHDIQPYLRIYKDGTIERLVGNEVTQASFDFQTGVASKDVVVVPETSVVARLYRPAGTRKLLPILIYFHGGAFCISSAFDPKYHATLNRLVAEAEVVAVSVNYRNAPENPLPAAYEDSWEVLRWVGSHGSGQGSEDWLKESADFGKVFLAGDSAGANIAHHLAIRAGCSNPKIELKIKGMVIRHPYFWGEEPIGIEAKDPAKKATVDKWWKFICPSDKGCDDPLINPFLDGGGLEKFAGLACDRILVFVAENDILVERGRRYYDFLIKSEWKGEAEIVETPGEDHVFHLFHPDSDAACRLIKRCASFIEHVSAVSNY